LPGLTRQSILFGKKILAKKMDTRVKPAYDAVLWCTAASRCVGWAKPPDANASGGVPTIQSPDPEMAMVGTAQERLCPPYD
jgi:hypothetical protein